jgi:hypothetical protein
MAEAVKKSYKLKKGAEHFVVLNGALQTLSGDNGDSVELFPEQVAAIADKLVIPEPEELAEPEEKEEKEEEKKEPVVPTTPPTPTTTPATPATPPKAS